MIPVNIDKALDLASNNLMVANPPHPLKKDGLMHLGNFVETIQFRELILGLTHIPSFKNGRSILILAVPEYSFKLFDVRPSALSQGFTVFIANVIEFVLCDSYN